MEEMKIIHWATPRSMSTVFEKVVSQVPGVDIIHEPFTNDYYFGPARKSSRYGDDEKLKRELSQNKLWQARSERITFIKELAFQGEPYISEQQFLDYKHSFMIRHPQKVLNSLVKLKPDATDEEFGFDSLMAAYVKVCNLAGYLPAVVEGDLFRQQPEPIFDRYATALGFTWEGNIFSWPEGRISSWSQEEEKSQAVWHKALEASNGILPALQDEVDVSIPKHLHGAFDRALDIYDILSKKTL